MLRRLLLLLAVLSWTLPVLAAPPAGDPAAPASSRRRVAVVHKPGVHAYGLIAYQIQRQVAADVRLMPLKDLGRMALLARLRRYRADVVLAVGQSAYDVVRDGDAVGHSVPVMHALAYHRLRAKHLPAHDPLPPPRVVLAALQSAKPVIRQLLLLQGPGGERYARRARDAAGRLGIGLRVVVAPTPAQAVSLLRGMGPQVDAVWLLPDLRICTPQVFQYALGLQFRRSMPLVGATLRHTREGALLSVDFDPRDLGRRAATRINRLVADARPRRSAPLRPRVSVNSTTARRLGALTAELRRAATVVTK